MKTAYKGDIVFTKSKDTFEIHKGSYLVVENNKVVNVTKNVDESLVNVIDYSNKLIIPSFVDLHFHAPQFRNIGLGLDEELIPWLNKYTFKEEAKFKDTNYAKKIYRLACEDLVSKGTSHVVVFGTIHNESNKILAQLADANGLKAFVGNVNMDRNSPVDLIETAQKSFESTQSFSKWISSQTLNTEYILTPRFAPSCSRNLLKRLGEYSDEYPIQTHMSENRGEVQWVKELFPECENYIDVYKKYNLINDKTIFAHCVYSTNEELEAIKDYNAYIAHCPNANNNLASGIMPLRKALDKGINVGLGTDVGAGHSTSILHVMQTAIQASKLYWVSNKHDKPITSSEAFFLGTKGGGKFFGKVGSFEPGYDFNAIVVDDQKFSELLTLEERVQRFIYSPNSQQIEARYFNGKMI